MSQQAQRHNRRKPPHWRTVLGLSHALPDQDFAQLLGCVLEEHARRVKAAADGKLPSVHWDVLRRLALPQRSRELQLLLDALLTEAAARGLDVSLPAVPTAPRIPWPAVDLNQDEEINLA